jgi:hypothetical protein
LHSLRWALLLLLLLQARCPAGRGWPWLTLQSFGIIEDQLMCSRQGPPHSNA